MTIVFNYCISHFGNALPKREMSSMLCNPSVVSFNFVPIDEREEKRTEPTTDRHS